MIGSEKGAVRSTQGEASVIRRRIVRAILTAFMLASLAMPTGGMSAGAAEATGGISGRVIDAASCLVTRPSVAVGAAVVPSAFSPSAAIAQQLPDWQQLVNDECVDVEVASDGKAYVLSSVAEQGGMRSVLAKLATDGSVIWTRELQGRNYGGLARPSLVIDPQGNAVVACGDLTPSGASSAAHTAKVSPDGEVLWERDYNQGNHFNHFVVDVCVDAVSNIYVVGFGGQYGGVNYDYFVVKYSPCGEREWVRYFSTESADPWGETARDAVLNGDALWITGSGNSAFFTVRLDLITLTSWTRQSRLGDDSVDEARSVDIDREGNVFVTGISSREGTMDCVTVSYGPDGAYRWTSVYDNPVIHGPDGGLVVRATSSGESYVGGATWGGDFDAGGTQWDILVMKLSEDGTIQWSSKWANPNTLLNEQVLDAALDNAGNFYVCGGDIGGNFITACYTPTGELAWIDQIDGPINNSDYAVAIDIDETRDRVLVAGSLCTRLDSAWPWQGLVVSYSMSPPVDPDPTDPDPTDPDPTDPDIDPVINIAGTTRYETAVKASQAAFPDGAETVVIATGRNWPDALGGSALAGVLDGPILLVATDSVPDVVSTELTRLGAKRAVIVGGELAVGAPVAGALAASNLTVERIAGTSRYQTADLVARRVITELGDAFDGTAFVATGGAYADAVACAPLAAAKGWPLYLAHPTSGITPATKTAMQGVTRALVLGGDLAVSESVKATLEADLGAANVTRLAGDSRYATAVAISAYGVEHAGLSWDRVGIATGQAYPDALAGGVLQGEAGSVMLLTRTASLSPETQSALGTNKAAITTVTYFGGDLAVSQAVRTQVGQALE
jgi:putative cell wall-binding protein